MKLDGKRRKLLPWGGLSSLLVVVILANILMTPAFDKPVYAQGNEDLGELWIDLSMGGPLVDTFNAAMRPDDIARVEHISQIDILDDVITGQRLVVFKSAADAERLLPHIHNKLDIIGYNLEHGPANPSTEQADPVGSIRSLRDAADEYDLRIALGPDHRFALSHAAEMAPYADILVLQIQKVQTEPDTVYDFILPLISSVRQANPDIEVSVQIRTEGDVDDLIDLLAPLQGEIEGISILTSIETVPFAKELIKELRGVESTINTVDRLPGNPNSPENGQAASAPEIQNSMGWKWVLVFILGMAALAFGFGYLGHRTGSVQGE